MVPLLSLLLLLALAFWIGKEFSYARRRKVFLSTRDSRGRPMPPPHQRVSDEEIAERARVLRGAVARGDISLDEAAGSLIRYAGGAMTPKHANDLLS